MPEFKEYELVTLAEDTTLTHGLDRMGPRGTILAGALGRLIRQDESTRLWLVEFPSPEPERPIGRSETVKVWIGEGRLRKAIDDA